MKNMKNILLALLAAMGLLATSCGKDDEGSRQGAGFDFAAPNNLRQTSQIQVAFDVECDAMPTVRFRTEGGALGVVSHTQETKFGVDYVYAGEPVTVNYSAGRATATFWYIPLTGGNHTVTFMVEYKQGGQAQTGINTQTFEVKDDWFGNFYPEVIGDDPGHYSFSFRNEVDKQKNGCKVYLMFVDVNDVDLTDLEVVLYRKGFDQTMMEKDTFYSIECAKWDPFWNDWTGSNGIIIRNDFIGSNTIHMTFRDDYNRCRDVEVKMDENSNLISSTYGDYYLWPKD